MAKFNFKTAGKDVMKSAQPILLGTAGVIAGQKFLDFKTLFPNVDPNKFFIKHEGVIKVGGVVVALAVFKNLPEWAKYLLIGVAIQGGIKAVRTYTKNPEGKAFVDQIGAGAFDAEINGLAAAVRNATNEFTTSVGADEMLMGLGAGVDQYLERNPAVNLNRNAAVSVGMNGMGIGEDESPLSGVGGI